MGRRIPGNPKILADNEELKKRKSDEMSESECCVVTGSSSFSKEQQLLEAAAFHLILLSNPLQQSYDYNKRYDSNGNTGNSGSLDGGFSLITGKKKKKTQDYGVEGIVKHENDKDANSVTSSASSSSAEPIKSEISSVSNMEENEVEDNKGTAQRLQQHRLRSIVDIYHVTSRL